MNRIVCSVLALASGLVAQDLGRGNVGFDGVEPELSVTSAAPNASAELLVQGLPKSQGVVVFLVAPLPGEVPLDALGIKGAVLGVDPGSLVVLGPVAVDGSGAARLQFVVHPAWKGASLWVQAAHVDSRVSPPLVLSDSRSMTLGSADSEIVVVVDGAGGTETALRRFPDGSGGTPLPRLVDVRFQDLTMSSLDERRTFRRDLARPIDLGGRQVIAFPDGSIVARYDSGARGRSGLVRVHAGGRVEVVAEDALGNFDPIVAASSEWLAFATLAPARLLLYRLAGNFKGTAEPVRDVTPVGGAIGTNGLVFGASVLAYAGRFQGFHLIPLEAGKPFQPMLPLSGGQRPAVFDEEVGVSGDGRVFVFGAGSGRKAKDVYVVRDDGTAVNTTNNVRDYAEVGYANPGRRTDLALSHDGSFVGYVDESGKEPENFVKPVKLPTTSHITSSTAFVDSIDIGSTARFRPKGGIVIVAGITATQLDLFYSPSMTDKDIIPLTKTGPATQAPFGRDAKLDLRDLGSVASGDQYLMHTKHLAHPTPELLLIDAGANTSRQVAAASNGLGIELTGLGRLLVDDAGAVVIVDPGDATATFRRPVPLASGETVVAMGFDPATKLAVVTTTGANAGLWLVDPALAVAARVPGASVSGPLLAGHVAGQVHFVSDAANGRTLMVVSSRGVQSLGLNSVRYFLNQ